jgi:histidinol-phosphate aminotransferase
MQNSFRKKLSSNLMRFEAGDIKVYIPRERYKIDLSLTENPLKFSPLVPAAIEKEKYNLNHYPDPYYSNLRKVLARQHRISPDKIIFGAGADGLIEDITRILINPGDQVVMPDLTFLNASFAAIIAGGKPVFSRMTRDFHIDFDDLKRKINKKTKMVFLCNPNNPTGIIEPKGKIIPLIKNCDALVVVDEANIEFGGESLITQVNDFRNLIIIRTFSKGHGLAGMRIGYCAGEKELMYYIWRLRPPFANTVLAQKAALAALRDRRHIEKSRIYVSKERKFLESELTSRGFTVIPSQANCFLAKVTPIFDSSTQFNELLHNHDATVVDGKYFRGLGKDYVRIAPQLHETNLEFIRIIDKLLGRRKKS